MASYDEEHDRTKLNSYVLSFVYVGICWNKLQYGCYPTVCSTQSLLLR